MGNSEEKCYNPKDATLTFVEGDDDMDFECIGYKSLRAKMSCGHTVTPPSLMKWCQRLLDQGATRFLCGVCDAEWPHEEVFKMALMTPEEIAHFDRTMSKRAVAKSCPGCKSFTVRKNPKDLRVLCSVCTANKGKSYEFCWQCLKEWKRPSPYPDRCAEDGCTRQQLEILRTCEEIKLHEVKKATSCPSTRACPTCGFLIVHSSKGCKNVTCSRCKVQFCFVCLRLSQECVKLMTGSYPLCFGGVAPRQTTIPVWKQK
ncbi:E3 ubiquitin-protein ligase ARIH2-like [Halichoeres trimaculatus]|uniref:E3 ubiquitin-protein ligase ARIH2-like n=1 Tax=Halichoeres trimaculatus TaxID=147232 RepID=UPI003D9EF742